MADWNAISAVSSAVSAAVAILSAAVSVFAVARARGQAVAAERSANDAARLAAATEDIAEGQRQMLARIDADAAAAAARAQKADLRPLEWTGQGLRIRNAGAADAVNSTAEVVFQTTDVLNRHGPFAIAAGETKVVPAARTLRRQDDPQEFEHTVRPAAERGFAMARVWWHDADRQARDSG